MPQKGEFKKNVSKETLRKRKYNARPEQKKNRVARNTARRRAEKKGVVHKGDGKDIDHVRQLGAGGSRNGKTRVSSRHANRSRGGRLGGKR